MKLKQVLISLFIDLVANYLMWSQYFLFIYLALLKEQIEKMAAEHGDDGYLDARIKFLQHQVNII